MRIKILASFFTLLLSCGAHAGTLTSNAADLSLNGSGMDSVSNSDLIIGGVGAYNRAVIPFQLPSLGAGSFTTASFSFDLNGVTTGSFNFAVNVHGLNRVDAAPSILSTDSGASSTLLQTGLVDIFSPNGFAATSDSATISGWLNTQYANGANAGKYVFVALQANTNAGSPTYSFYSASDPGVNLRPFGTYTFAAVPEPSTYGLIGAGVLFSVAFMRRRKR